jgi:hypothetical protein
VVVRGSPFRSEQAASDGALMVAWADCQWGAPVDSWNRKEPAPVFPGKPTDERTKAPESDVL